MIAEIDARCGAERPEELVVRVQRGGVAVVVVDDGQAEALLEAAAEVVVAPAGVGEVRGPARRDDALGARRARRVEADPADALARDPGAAQDVLERENEGLDRDVRPLRHAARALEELVHEKAPRGVEDGGVVLVAPVVEPHHHPAVGLHCRSFPGSGDSSSYRQAFARILEAPAGGSRGAARAAFAAAGTISSRRSG